MQKLLRSLRLTDCGLEPAPQKPKEFLKPFPLLPFIGAECQACVPHGPPPMGLASRMEQHSMLDHLRCQVTAVPVPLCARAAKQLRAERHSAGALVVQW